MGRVRAGHPQCTAVLWLLVFVAVTAMGEVRADPVTFVDASSAAAGDTEISVAVPGGVQEGDVMIAQFAFRGTADRGFTPPDGWTEFAPRLNFQPRANRGQNQAIFYRVATADEPDSYLWAIDPVDPGRDHLAVAIAAYRDVDVSEPIAAWEGQSGNATNPVAPEILVNGVLSEERTATSGGGGSRPYIGHRVALNPAESEETRLIAAWSRSHQQTVTAPADMNQRITDSSGGGNNGQRVTLADEELLIEGATRLRFDQQPTDTDADQIIEPAVTVRIENSDGELVQTDDPVTVSIEDNPGGGTLSGTTTVNAVDGIATFDDLSIDQPGEGYTLRADSEGLDPDISVEFNITFPGTFNAFDTETPGGAISGPIRTKIAAEPFDFDIVAIEDGAPAEGFNGRVDVYLLDASDNSAPLDENNCRDSWEQIGEAVAEDVEDWPDNEARVTISDVIQPEAWREVRVRIVQTHPPGQAQEACSTAAFAIRPDAFVNVVFRDADWESPGTDRTLDNTDPDGGVVHKAGRPFRIDATAVNAAGAVTENYDGQPELVTECLAPDGCVDGEVTPGDWTVAAGELSTDEAVHSEVGVFELTVEDREFAEINAGDSTEDERFIRSGNFEVGRFVPDHFRLTEETSPVLLTFGDEDCDEAEYTYIGQPFGYETRPVTLIEAMNADGDVAQNYSGGLWKLESGDVDQDYDVETDPEGDPEHELDTDEIALPDVESGDDGTGTTTPDDQDRLRFTRIAPDPGEDPPEPFRADITLTVDVSDDSESGVSGQGTIHADEPLIYDGDGDGIPFTESDRFRYGRLRLVNAIGPENRDLEMRVDAETWRPLEAGGDVSGWRRDDADRCTPLSQGDFTLFADEVGTSIAGFDNISEGRGLLTLEAPGTVGQARVRAQLEDDFDWLQYDWDGDGDQQNPEARAAFGLFDGNPRRVHQRETTSR